MSLSQKLEQLVANLEFLGVEMALISGAILILLLGLITSKGVIIRSAYVICLLAAFILQLQADDFGFYMLGSLHVFALGKAFVPLFIAVALLLIVFRRSSKHAPEFYFFVLSILLGAIVLTKAGSLLIAYLAIELLSFCSYLITSFSFKKKSFEAALKYLLFGAIGSAIMLFGIGLIYGATGSLYLQELGSLPANSGVVGTIGLMLFILGLFFKASVFPMHIWVPATYQHAPIDATAFLSVVPKLAAILFLRQIYSLGVLDGDDWVSVVVKTAGILTMVVGTLGAFNQNQVRRLIAFGAIAHTGFLLPFAFLLSDTASEAFWYYSVIYSVMNLAIFFFLSKMEESAVWTLDQYRNLSGNYYIFVTMTIVMVSLIGIPPLAGFTAKLFMFFSLWESFILTKNAFDFWYMMVAIAATIGSLFFYFRMPKAIFLQSSLDGAGDTSLKMNLSTKIAATIFTLVLLLTFFAPELVQDLKLMLTNVHE